MKSNAVYIYIYVNGTTLLFAMTDWLSLSDNPNKLAKFDRQNKIMFNLALVFQVSYPLSCDFPHFIDFFIAGNQYAIIIFDVHERLSVRKPSKEQFNH